MSNLNLKQSAPLFVASKADQNHLTKELAEEFNDTAWPNWLNNFVVNYQKLSVDNLTLLEQIYHPDIIFIDPIHHLTGFDNLQAYFQGLYQNLSACDFTINEVIVSGDKAAIYWEMIYKHPKLKGGKPVTVLGNSHIKGLQDKVIYHRDYLDVGAMLYEQLPVIGKVVKYIKNKAAK